jgi:catechol 2,3-dioxygenase-like lactoylglutathione lyase family enzyme
MRVTRVLHVSVNTVGCLEEARGFYERVLGLSSAPRPEIPGVPGHWYAIGDAELHLVAAPPGVWRNDPAGEGEAAEPDGARVGGFRGEGPSSAADPTGNHFCLAVDDIEQAVAELEARGIPYLRGAQGDVVQVWIADPAGNTIELQADRPRG